jgi:endo-1,4-beta-xylanase
MRGGRAMTDERFEELLAAYLDGDIGPEDLAELENSILAYAKLGDVMITELDISVLPFPEKDAQGADLNINLELKAKYNPYTEGLPADVQQAQDQRFLDIFKVFLTHQDKISRVTFWGVNDGHSWKNGWPMQGRTDYPLLIDRNNRLKPVTIELFRLKDSFPLPAE